MIIALIIIVSVLTYAFVGGYVGNRVYTTRFDRCRNCRDVRDGERYASCEEEHELRSFVLGLVWPIALPMLVGMLAADGERKASRAELKHQRRLEVLAAEKELANQQRRKTIADIEFLAANGIKAEVSGLYEEQS